jgi:hypothetical protein
MAETLAETWHMPGWMEPYRKMIATNGESVESLMNDTTTTFFANSVRMAIIHSVETQVALLERLFGADLLTPFGHVLADAGGGAVQCHVCRSLWPSIFAIGQTRTCGEMKDVEFPERD